MRIVKIGLGACAATLLLAGCGSGGIAGRERPDEFAVTRNQPLVIPPDYALTPPKTGEPTPVGTDARTQALEALFGGPAPRSQSRAFDAQLGRKRPRRARRPLGRRRSRNDRRRQGRGHPGDRRRSLGRRPRCDGDDPAVIPSPCRGEGQASEARQGEGTASIVQALTLPPLRGGPLPLPCRERD